MYRRPAEIPRARLPLLDQVTIKTSCRESWDAMTGDDRMRFCTRCSKNVYDLSAMTQDEAEAFLATHLDADDTCVRLYRRPDGRILTSECVQGARTRHARKVGVGIAVGLCAAFTATLALANVHIPDGRNLPKARARIDVKRLGKRAPVTHDVTIPSDEVPPELLELRRRDEIGFAMGGIGPAASPEFPPHGHLHEVDVKVDGGLPRDVVSRTVRVNYGRIRLCYEPALRNNPALEGGVAVHFLVASDGSVASAEDAGSDLPDPSTVRCIVRSFRAISFPQPGGFVNVSYRVSLKPAP